jgi:hypothetical protein
MPAFQHIARMIFLIATFCPQVYQLELFFIGGTNLQTLTPMLYHTMSPTSGHIFAYLMHVMHAFLRLRVHWYYCYHVHMFVGFCMFRVAVHLPEEGGLTCAHTAGSLWNGTLRLKMHLIFPMALPRLHTCYMLYALCENSFSAIDEASKSRPQHL